MIKLSVVVPCFNVAEFLPETIRSLARNTDPRIEYLFVDDASQDGTAALLEAELDHLPGARLIKNSLNRGLAATRNVGLDAARGEHLAFLDGDDFVAPGYYTELVATIERLAVDFVRTDHVRVLGRRRTIDRVPYGPRSRPRDPRSGILPDDRNTSVDYPFAWAGIYHRRLADAGLLHFTPGLRTCEDRPWNWRLHLGADSFAVVGLLGVFYRRGITSSLSQVTDTRQFDFVPAFDQILADVAADPECELLLPKALRSYAAILCHHLRRLDSYAPPLDAALRTLCEQAARRLPREELIKTAQTLDPDRRRQLSELIGAAA
ncbi:glycosyltransferase family 2 protein [Microlunatus panaciterrae]|uniref:Glycosyltransferase involved in cell wall biosynthesis n=1 Tax=Microlunatus panaciterrae TaxID=400768 RepID=A0ABS2RH89_9ACTN|nr:glycosyltransferase involved in cell wall biosynthesis [Microlunatus panaciterrae]